MIFHLIAHSTNSNPMEEVAKMKEKTCEILFLKYFYSHIELDDGKESFSLARMSMFARCMRIIIKKHKHIYV